jgi:hypothetical protein
MAAFLDLLPGWVSWLAGWLPSFSCWLAILEGWGCWLAGCLPAWMYLSSGWLTCWFAGLAGLVASWLAVLLVGCLIGFAGYFDCLSG